VHRERTRDGPPRGRALGTITSSEEIGDRQVLARTLLDTLLREAMIEGIFHADPHPVGRVDAGLRAALQRLLLAVDRGDPAALHDALLEIVERPEELDDPALERALGQFMARHVGPGITPDARMFTGLFRILAEHELSVPPEIAGAFRALATIEGTLTELAPGFDILAEARRFTTEQLAEQLSPEALRKSATDELISLVPMLRRLPRRLDRISGSLEHGRLGINVRLLADAGDRLPDRPRAPVHPHIPGRHPRRDGRADARSPRRPERDSPSHAIRVHRLLPPRVRRDSCAARTVTCVPPRRRLTRAESAARDLEQGEYRVERLLRRGALTRPIGLGDQLEDEVVHRPDHGRVATARDSRPPLGGAGGRAGSRVPGGEEGSDPPMGVEAGGEACGADRRKLDQHAAGKLRLAVG
jgi:hypothetical protein